MLGTLSDSRLANIGARLIRDEWNSFTERFRIVTKRARLRFVEGDGAGMAADHVERLDLYNAAARRTGASMRVTLGSRVEDRSIWAAMKAVYSGLIQDRSDWELAETFFNSVTRRIFDTVGVDPRVEFVDTDFQTPPHDWDGSVSRVFERESSTAGLVSDIARTVGFAAGYEDLDRDCAAAAERIDARVDSLKAGRVESAEVASSVFYRGGGAYLVGRIGAGALRIPFAMALLKGEHGLVVDAVLTSEQELSILFSFTRSYFHVDCDRPYAMVDFLSELMPRKRRSELYTSIGHHKHGKTEMYRDLRRHLVRSGDRFETAAGTPGLVMEVFTLPGFEVVFKVIKDKFGAPKQLTREHVRSRYRLVFKHDRAGRLVDAQEYEHLEFPVDRFERDLLERLLATCSRTVRLGDGVVDIDHCYIERRVTPLDVYLDAGTDAKNEAAVIDFGQAIRDLAASDIFPGDMLIKNFGVTRHGRVVFYDYDELTTLEECKFRKMPQAASYEDEMADSAWFPVGPADVFPEEFETFLGLEGHLREVFLAKHSELFDASVWRSWQDRIAAGETIDIYPYADAARLRV